MTSKGNGKSSDRRAGKRKDRNKRVGTRIPELGYYLIVTDTEETEKNYFEGLRDSIPAELKDHLVIKVEIVFDRDQVKDFDEIIRLAEKNDINAGWSNPCFEIWMFAYFGEMPAIMESYICCDRFAEKFEKVTGQKYSKNDRDIYRKLGQYGDEEKAIQIAKRCYKKCMEDGKIKPSEMWPVCTLYKLVEEIHMKLN